MAKVVGKKFNVLFTCIGRRVSLLRSFRRAAAELDIEAHFYGTEVTELNPGYQESDKGFLVRPIEDAGYIEDILSIVRENDVQVIVPTIDTDLLVLSQHKEEFAELGCAVMVSEAGVVEVCQDKRKTYDFLCEHKFGTVATKSYEETVSGGGLEFPYFLKPWDGCASRGNAMVKNREELEFYGKRIPNCIVQEYIEGEEYTCDVYVDFEKAVRCVVPRKRIEVRAGEVSKSQIVKDSRIMEEGKRLVEELGAGPGVVTLQLFVTGGGDLKFIEINPRFGGGVPLSIKSGADFPKCMLGELSGEKAEIEFEGFEDGLVMLRYDDEVWFEG